ncbi:hypothetical protein O181_012018 [Austropuccinia psidii MF-1]|uniref:FHA domain-containing protein n=1 Tax=Austropuccinia psidii MF-1 TaxID=1389203 RepID=A0A9Q3BWE2_9BASI|nr:hypothetical protein [Austropuccinia psidii MF-1]
MSENHAQLFWNSNLEPFIKDLGSTHGTWIKSYIDQPFHRIQPYQSVKLLHHMHICFGRAITSLNNGIRHTPEEEEEVEEEDLDHLEDDLEEVDQEEEEEIDYQKQDEQDDYANHQDQDEKDPIALLNLTFIPGLHLSLGNSSISQFANLARVLISSHDSIQSISAPEIIRRLLKI